MYVGESKQVVMINTINSYKSYTNFQGKNTTQKPQVSAADKFISDTNKEVEKFTKENSYNNIPPTALLVGIGVILAFFGGLSVKCKKLKIAGETEKLAKLKNSAFKNSALALISSFGAATGLSYYFNRNKDKHFNDVKQYLNNVNKTNAKLAQTTFNSPAAAFYSPANGQIYINKNQLNDPLSRLSLKAMLRHELVHAKQFEMIARSKDGIKKLNYYCINNLVKEANKNPVLKQEYEKIYNDIQNDKTGKYDDIVLKTTEADFPLKKYITAIHIRLNNEKASYNDLPIFIDAKHYEDIIKKEGNLSKEEEEKANKYYEAALNYATPTALEMLNPFSDYYNNLLEKEAYKENPWYTRII